MRFSRRTIAGLLILLLCSNQTLAAEDASSGKKIALQWCSSCHVVAEGQVAAFTAIPTFSAIAKKYKESPRILDAFLTAPQHAMPDMNLTRDEIRDLTAYIKTLE